jgi:hypothetical protein
MSFPHAAYLFLFIAGLVAVVVEPGKRLPTAGDHPHPAAARDAGRVVRPPAAEPVHGGR